MKEAYVKTPLRVVDFPDVDGLYVRLYMSSPEEGEVDMVSAYQVSGDWLINMTSDMSPRDAHRRDDFVGAENVLWVQIPTGMPAEVVAAFKHAGTIHEVGPDGEWNQSR